MTSIKSINFLLNSVEPEIKNFVFQLKTENRQLRAENRKLQKQIARLEVQKISCKNRASGLEKALKKAAKETSFKIIIGSHEAPSSISKI